MHDETSDNRLVKYLVNIMDALKFHISIRNF